MNGLASLHSWPIMFVWLEDTEMVSDRVTVTTMMPAWPYVTAKKATSWWPKSHQA